MTSLNRYVTIVAAAGIGLLALAMAHGIATGSVPDSPTIWLFAAALVIAECMPMRVVHDASEGEITMSSTFALALLFEGGLTTAMCAMAIGAVCSDALRRKPPSRMVFNVGQYALAIGASAAVLGYLSDSSPWASHPLTPDLLPAFAAAAFVFFVLNSMLVARAVTLAEGVEFWSYLRRDIALQTSTVGILLGLAPIVVITADFSLAALPLLGLPLFAVHGAGRLAIANQRQAQHDALTELPNRALLQERLNQAIRAARREERGVAVLLIDLDRFKEINDTLGHHEGDRVLQMVASRLGPAVRDGDTVARFGGDEFVIVLRDVDEADDVTSLALKLASVIEEPLEFGERVLQVGASIGAARYPHDGEDSETLLRRADVAMYRAKHARQRFRLYAHSEDPHSPQRLQLAAELHRAVRTGGLVAYFQPKVSMHDGRVEGVEVLMRWPHPERGKIPMYE